MDAELEACLGPFTALPSHRRLEIPLVGDKDAMRSTTTSSLVYTTPSESSTITWCSIPNVAAPTGSVYYYGQQAALVVVLLTNQQSNRLLFPFLSGVLMLLYLYWTISHWSCPVNKSVLAETSAIITSSKNSMHHIRESVGRWRLWKHCLHCTNDIWYQTKRRLSERLLSVRI
jgi:hypothetical protein